MDSDAENLALSLTESFRSDTLADAMATLGDIGIDAAIGAGALDGVPIFGALTGLYRAGREVSQQFYRKKVLKFLQGLSALSETERNAFTEGLYARREAEQFGETLLHLLEKADELSKPTLIARIFVAHIQGRLRYPLACRLATISNRSFYSDLIFLKTFKPGLQEEGYIVDSLVAVGLLKLTGIDGGNATNEGIENEGFLYDFSDLGKLMIEFA